MAPASHIGATVEAMRLAAQPSYALGYATYVLQSFASNHRDIDLAKILTPQAMINLPQTRKDCISKTVSTGYWATAIPKDQFLANADLAPVLQVATQNEPGGLKIAVPSLIVQGTSDTTVMPAWTDETVRNLCRQGNDILYTVYPGADHETIVARSSAQISAWIDARFAGTPAGGNCDKLPAAAKGNSN